MRHTYPPTPKVIALAGNPNVGKSTVFNALTGLHQHTGNWSGKTVESAKGRCRIQGQLYTVADLPGCYSLRTSSKEEEITRTFLMSEQPELIVVVCDPVSFERNLHLVLQILTLTRQVVLCINLMDQARKKGISISFDKLEDRLGIPVIGITARKKSDIARLKQVMGQALTMSKKIPQPVLTCTSHQKMWDTRPLWDKEISSEIYNTSAARLYRETVRLEAPSKSRAKTWDIAADHLFTGTFTGIPCMLLFLLLILWLTLTGANLLSDKLSYLLFSLEPILFDKLTFLFPIKLCHLLVYGMYRVTAWVVSVMLPPMALFFPLFSLLEDFGYLPRVAFNLDCCFAKCKACGKQALTMMMGFGCNAVGVTGCRIMDSPRERMIAILTNSFVPCNGRFPTILAILTLFFAGGLSDFGSGISSFFLALMLTGVILLGIGMTLLSSWLLSKTLLKGLPSSFTLELPPYRKPQILSVLLHSFLSRTLGVLGRALLSAAPAGLIIWLLANVTWSGTSLLFHISRTLDPFAQVFGLDGTILLAFLLGIPANEIVVPIMIMAYTAQSALVNPGDLSSLHSLLTARGWTIRTAVCVLIFCLMHWPCAATLLTIKKETQSLKWTALGFLLPTVMGFLCCFLVTLFFSVFV